MDTANPSPYGGAPSWFLLGGEQSGLCLLGSLRYGPRRFLLGFRAAGGGGSARSQIGKKDLGAVGSSDLSLGSSLSTGKPVMPVVAADR